ncbi:MAG: phage tail tape measure protein [Pseudomonadota bacterium]
MFSVQAVMSLIDNITGPLRSITAGMDATSAGSDRLSARMGRLAKAMLPLVAAAGLVIGIFGVAVGATMDTQAALGELASVGITDMQALSGAAEEFSGQWSGTTKPEFLSAAYDIKSGISSLTDAGVAEFTKLAALTGKATKSSTAEMTSLFATGYGIYKGMYADLSDMQFGEVFSAGISGAVKNFKTTGSGMAQAISSLGATATTAKVPLAEQLSILGMLQATMSGSEAGTKYKAMMQSAAGAGQKLGLQFMDSNNQLLSMPDILTAMRGKYGDTLDAMEKMEIQKAFGTQEAVAVLDLLYGKLGDLTGNINGMGAVMGTGTAATKAMADTMNQDLGAVLQLTGQKWHNMMEVIGNVFEPMVISAVTWIGKLSDVLNVVAKSPVGKALILIAGIVSLAVLAFTAFAGASYMVGLAIPFITASLAPLGAAVAAVSWPIWLVIAAVGGLYLAWRKNFGGIADTVSGWWKTISLVFRGVVAVFETLTGTTGKIEGQLAKDIQAAGLVGLVTTVSQVVYRIYSFFDGLWDGLSEGISLLGDIFGPVLVSLVDAFRPLGEVIAYVGRMLGFAGESTSVSTWYLLGNVLGTVAAVSLHMLAWAIRIAITPIQWMITLAGLLVSAFVWVGEAIGNTVGWIVTAFERLSNFDLFEAGAAMIKSFADGIVSVFELPGQMVDKAFSFIGKLLPHSDAQAGPLSTLTASGASIMETLAGGAQTASPSFVQTIQNSVSVGPGTENPGPGAMTIRNENGQSRSETGGGRRITIQNLSVTLPNVENGDSFIRDLQRFVEAYDAG